MRRLLLCALVLPAVASAVPLTLTHSGRLLDSAGSALTGDHDLTVALYDAPSGGTPVWTDTFPGVPVQEGYFALVLGSGEALSVEDVASDALWVGMAIDGGTELSPRMELSSVPFALRADTSTNVAGGTVDATEVIVGGTTVIDADGVVNASSVQIDGTEVLNSGGLSAAVSWSDLDGVPSDLVDGDADALTALTGCDNGGVAIFDGGTWSCSGTIALTHLSVGTSSDSLAAGDHSHTVAFSDLDGQAALEQLPLAGTGDDGVAYANHTHSGVVKPTNVSDTCDEDATDLHGTLSWDDDQLRICTANGWRVVARTQPDGGTRSNAGIDCKTLLESDDTFESGLFWIDPDGDGGEAPVQTYCDMETDGGGWTLAAYAHSASTGTSSSNRNHHSLRCGGGEWSPAGRGSVSAAINAIALAQSSTEMAISMNVNGSPVGSGSMQAYQHAYAIEIPDPSTVNFVSQAWLGGKRGGGDDQTGPCVQTAVRGLKGYSGNHNGYLFKHSLGVTWNDTYPTGYGVADNASCTSQHNGFPMVTSFHTGHGSGNSSHGPYFDACDVTHGTFSYNHRGNYAHTGVNTTGGNAIWFR